MGRAYNAFKKAAKTRKHHKTGAGLPLDPVLRPNGKRRKTPRMTWNLAPTIEEEYQKLRGNLFLGTGRTEIKSILMVASMHGEGTTTTAALFAAVLARANASQLLLIDANLRTPSIAEFFHLTGDTRGFTDLMTGSVTLHEIIRPTPLNNLSVITSGRPFHSPSHLFNASSIEKFLGILYEQYDLIILDGPPVQDYADANFLSAIVDGTILVVEAEKTKIETIQGTKRQLERSGAHMLGTVLNKKQRYLPAFLDRLL